MTLCRFNGIMDNSVILQKKKISDNLISSVNKHKKGIVIMEAITEEQEKRIDNSVKYFGYLRFQRDDDVIFENKEIYLYGEVDFDNPEDVAFINNKNFVNVEGNSIYSTFDYDKGVYTTIDGYPKMVTIDDPIRWFKYCYCLLGKPKRIIVYKCVDSKKRCMK